MCLNVCLKNVYSLKISLTPSPGMVGHTGNTSSQEAKVGRWSWGLRPVCNYRLEFQGSQGRMRSCLKKTPKRVPVAKHLIIYKTKLNSTPSCLNKNIPKTQDVQTGVQAHPLQSEFNPNLVWKPWSKTNKTLVAHQFSILTWVPHSYL